MSDICETEKKVALMCIAMIDCHFPLNEGERRLLCSVVNDIRLTFDLEGAVKPASHHSGAAWTPRIWFW